MAREDGEAPGEVRRGRRCDCRGKRAYRSAGGGSREERGWGGVGSVDTCVGDGFCVGRGTGAAGWVLREVSVVT